MHHALGPQGCNNLYLPWKTGVYNRWTGLVDWTGGLDWWTGLWANFRGWYKTWTLDSWTGPWTWTMDRNMDRKFALCNTRVPQNSVYCTEICQGCRGTVRAADGSIPEAPYNVVVARLEQRPFRDSTGVLKTLSRPSAAHYHVRLTCIRTADPNFVPNSLVIPGDVASILTLQHHASTSEIWIWL